MELTDLTTTVEDPGDAPNRRAHHRSIDGGSMIRAQQLDGLLEAAVRRYDVVLGVFIIVILVMIVLPIPTPLVDVLIACNIAGAVVLAMIAVYIQTPLAFSAFPSVLLLTTLFRLALTITTTRLILLDADAGEIVETFGNFVVGGNIVVGMVIFLIITVVQFVVVTKGAERVAEVSARFSLDGLPGKQMSIDADMRAGVIDFAEARRRRQIVQDESQLFGSMDGAMKFVKGDAIAGLFIIFINLVGGISIGVLQQDMAFAEASSVFTTLTVGDGLVAQIPALLISITAGIIVTRVTTSSGMGLGQDIGRQILAQPRALMVGGVLLMGFAIVPGFPAAAFLIVGSLLGGIGLILWMAERRAEEQFSEYLDAVPGGDRKQLGMGGRQTELAQRDELPGSAALVLELSHSLQPALNPEALNDEFRRVRQSVYEDLGVPLAGVQVRYANDLDEDTYRICLHEVPVASGRIPQGRVLAFASTDRLKQLGIEHTDAGVMAGTACSLVAVSERATLDAAEIGHGDINQVLVRHLSWAVKRHASELVGVQVTKGLLDRLQKDANDLVREVNGVVSLSVFTEVLKRMLAENIPIRNLQLICEVLLEKAQKQTDPMILTEFVRERLKRQISHRFSDRDRVLNAIVLGPDAERAIREAGSNAQGESIPLAQSVRSAVVQKVKKLVAANPSDKARPVVVVAQDIRRFVRKILAADLPETPVLAFQELAEDINVKPLGQVNAKD